MQSHKHLSSNNHLYIFFSFITNFILVSLHILCYCVFYERLPKLLGLFLIKTNETLSFTVRINWTSSLESTDLANPRYPPGKCMRHLSFIVVPMIFHA